MRVTDKTGRVQHNHVTTSVGYACSSTKRVHCIWKKVATVCSYQRDTLRCAASIQCRDAGRCLRLA
ncbi:MAG: hypothetical protein ACREVM_05490 [Burkholderiales bacterium]